MNKNIFRWSLCIIFSSIILLSSCGQNRDEKVDNDFKKQWGLENSGRWDELEIEDQDFTPQKMKKDIDINYSGMWAALPKNFPQKEIVVALIDSGVDFSNDELKKSRWENVNEIPNNELDDDRNGYVDDVYGWDFINNYGVPQNADYSNNDHGTICAGIIAAEKNGKGIEGITRGKKIKMMDLRVLDSTKMADEGSIDDVIAAIKYAEKNGARICNLSLSTESNDINLYNAIKDSKMLFITSAGNNTSPLRINIDKKKLFPASYDLPNLISVTNIGFDGVLFIGSNIGPNSVKMAAPGTVIYSTLSNSGYGYSTGSSFAAPYVTGVAAVLYQYIDYPTPKNVNKILCESVTRLQSLDGKVLTGGMLNGMKAVTLARIYAKDYD